MHNIKELKIWNKSIELAKEIYLITKDFPKEEQFGLVNQLRRAAVSVASNIAEGAGRNSEKEFVQFLSIAYGSLFEIQTQIIIANQLNYINSEVESENILNNIEELEKMIFVLRNNIKQKIKTAN